MDLDLLVNTTLLEERTILVDPQQELILNFDIDLPSEGLSLVELVFNIEDVENSIYFSVNYTDNQRKTLPWLVEYTLSIPFSSKIFSRRFNDDL